VIRALIVEDIPREAVLLARMLEELGCAVTVTDSVESAVIQLVVANHFDIAFVDYLLKRDFPLTGLNVAQWIHDADPATRVVMVTGFSPEDVVDRHGGTVPEWITWLAKPYTMADLQTVFGEEHPR